MKKLLMLIGLFLVLKTSLFAQDTAKLVSSRQMVRYGKIDSHQIKTYKLSLYRNGEDKIMTISDSVGNVAFYRADEYLGARQLTDTLVVYYQGVRLSPTEEEVTIVLLVKDDAYLEIIIKQEDGLIMFVIDPAILPTTKRTP